MIAVPFSVAVVALSLLAGLGVPAGVDHVLRRPHRDVAAPGDFWQSLGEFFGVLDPGTPISAMPS